MAYEYDFKFFKLEETASALTCAAYLGNSYVGAGRLLKPQSSRPEFDGMWLTEEGQFLAPLPILTKAFLNWLHTEGYPQIWLETMDKEVGEALGFTLADSIYSGEAPLFLFVHQCDNGNDSYHK